MAKQYSLHLISPRQRFINYPAHNNLSRMFGKRRMMIPLALPVVASLTPENYDIRIFDEEIERLPRRKLPDIVGITTLAATAKRAYELADDYRKRGVTVILGGPHATYVSEEALAHADAVIVGEAEGNWERCLADWETGKLQKTYRNPAYADYSRHAPPRWDLVNMKRLFQVSIQTSRGCPFDCEFCTVTKMFGKKVRHRSVEDVVAEIRTLPTRYAMFVDDNLTINKAYARELMLAIKPFNLSWACMCSIDIAKDEELLALMADAGCFNILIGFESLNPASLQETNKHQNQGGDIFADAILRVHSFGIHINASFVVGFDHDDLSEFDRIIEFTNKHSLPNVNLHLLGAAPGSETHSQLLAAGRIPPYDLDMGVGHFPIIDYMNVSQIDLFEKYMATINDLYSFRTIRAKAERLFAAGMFIRPGADISPGLKFRLCLYILRYYILSPDSDARAAFWHILSLIRSRKLAVDKGLGYLLSMLSYHLHLADHRRDMPEYRRLIAQYDRGPWRLIRDKQPGESLKSL